MADPAMARYARQLVESSVGSATADVTTQVRELVLTLIGSGRCTVDQVAQHMGVDRRTIHRHLAGEGETFSNIVDSVRKELAARYMKNRNRTLNEVSSLLGFSAPSGFSRWYRKQFSCKASQGRSARRRAA